MPDPNAQGSTPSKTAWKQMLSNPVVLGAIITGYVTLNTAIFGYLNSRNAQQLEEAKSHFAASLNERKYETSLILEVTKATGQDQELLFHRLCLLAASGLIPQTERNLKTARGFDCPEIREPTSTK
jgi:hypothetical protein